MCVCLCVFCSVTPDSQLQFPVVSPSIYTKLLHYNRNKNNFELQSSRSFYVVVAIIWWNVVRNGNGNGSDGGGSSVSGGGIIINK